MTFFLFCFLKQLNFHLKQCYDENIKLRETEEKIKRAEEDKKRREKEKEARKTQKDKLMKPSNNGDMGVMDNLIEALQSGEIFETTSGGLNNRVRRAPREPRRDAASDFRRTVHRPAATQNLISAQ